MTHSENKKPGDKLDTRTAAAALVPLWLHRWHLINLLILSDLLFVILRPATFPGGSLGFLFPVFHYYMTKDTVFADLGDRALKSIYVLGVIDALLVFYLLYAFGRMRGQPWFLMLCFFREVMVMTKTALYVMYSYYHIVPSWRLFLTLLNGAWVYIPVLCCVGLTSRLQRRFVAVA